MVATEVKDLAQETARATEDIARRVEAIQGGSGGAVEAIAQVSTISAVARAAHDANVAANDTATAAQELARMAVRMEQLIGQFRYSATA